QIGRAWRQADPSNALSREHLPKCSAVLRVAIEEQILLAHQRSINDVQQVAPNLHHPVGVGVERDSRDANASRGKLNDKQYIVCHQSTPTPELHSKEVSSRQRLPMRLQKDRPGHSLAAYRGRFD